MDPIASNKVASASQRQQLQQLFDRALRLKDGSRDDLVAACELFRRCFVNDPGNLIYAQSWLGAMERLAEASGGHRTRRSFFLSWAIRNARRRRDWSRVIDLATRCLLKEVTNANWLTAIAEACDELEHELIGILVLRHAARLHDQNDQVFRRLAYALARSGDFNDARRCWHRVDLLCHGDEEAREELAKLGDAPPLAPEERAAETTPLAHSVDAVVRRIEEIESLVATGQFDRAQQVLNQAMSQLGNDIRLRQRGEQLLLDQVIFEIGVARQRLEEQPNAENKQLVERLCRELNRREIDFFATRSARYPEQPSLKLELGLRLKNAGIFAEAISEFTELLDDPDLGPVAAMETGECWQSLRQFDRALEFYRQAIEATSGTDETYKRSRYRAAILLEAMGKRQQAQQLFSELLQVDRDYKDAAERLDKIRQIRHDT